ncbi:hypothetical protein CEP52_001690, partial [Fusarium oligoseptatum]
MFNVKHVNLSSSKGLDMSLAAVIFDFTHPHCYALRTNPWNTPLEHAPGCIVLIGWLRHLGWYLLLLSAHALG